MVIFIWVIHMKYYQELGLLGVFTYEDACQIIKSSNPMKTLLKYIDLGYIRRIKRNLYVCVDLINGEDVVDKYTIASKVNEASFLVCHSAFEFYGYYNQVFYNCQIGSIKKFSEFEYGGINYEYFSTDSLIQVESIKGARVTSIERTIIDSIDLLGKAMDIEELLKCLELIQFVSEEKLKEVLLAYNKDLLYRKCGYILSYFKEALNISDSFFDFCLSKSNIKNRGKISNYEINKLEYIPKWHLYAYKDLLKLMDKGKDIDV